MRRLLASSALKCKTTIKAGKSTIVVNGQPLREREEEEVVENGQNSQHLNTSNQDRRTYLVLIQVLTEPSHSPVNKSHDPQANLRRFKSQYCLTILDHSL